MSFGDRKYDVLALGTRPDSIRTYPDSDAAALFTSSDNGAVCAGAQKLAQRWALEFLTIRGSMGFHLSERGSDFVAWARSGLIRTELDVQAYFGFAATQVKTQLLNEDAEDDPADERIDNAELTRIVISNTHMALSITLTTQAGTSREIILPVAATPPELQSQL